MTIDKGELASHSGGIAICKHNANNIFIITHPCDYAGMKVRLFKLCLPAMPCFTGVDKIPNLKDKIRCFCFHKTFSMRFQTGNDKWQGRHAMPLSFLCFL